MSRAIPRRLRLLERERTTGVLRVGDDGAFEVVNGVVTFAESPHAPGAERLAGEARAPSPDMLALIAAFDAAYFLVASAAEPEFVPGERLDSAAPCRLTVATLVHECDRRRELLTSRWPHEPLDRVPVIPVHRVRRQRVILTGLEAEILLNADGRRTPVDLAHHLGRPAFACLLAVHDLAAASLLQGEAVPATCHRRAGRGFGTAVPDHSEPHHAEPGRAVLERAGPGRGGPDWEPPDLALLTRLRAALEDLT
ncbi:hypothetical protein ACGFNU_25270 [Spirillospora sp. NPDC048911]|uniref:hypothetical protein n=1 Tax=Spirillospora sp. NPDC048911 TaxID=3364527 RepID=UPI003716C8ED